MSDTVMLALVAAIPPTLTSLTALIVAIRNGRKTDRIETQAALIGTKTDLVTKHAQQIATGQQIINEKVNGNLTELKQALDLALSDNENLKRTVRELGGRRDSNGSNN